MTNITIPPEALEAAARANYSEWVRLESAFTGIAIGDFEWWDGLDEEARDEWRKKARAACLAMLNAWPDSILMPAELILPLPQENALVANGIAVIRSETLEEAARVAEGFPARTHGNLSADPFEAAEQAANECAAAIRALISPAAEEQSPKGE